MMELFKDGRLSYSTLRRPHDQRTSNFRLLVPQQCRDWKVQAWTSPLSALNGSDRTELKRDGCTILFWLSIAES